MKGDESMVKNRQFKFIVFLAILLSITAIAYTYGIFNSGEADSITKGVIDDTLYINDLASDYYYYTGQNYTYSSDGMVPSLENKNIYNDNNLVKVIITYDGKDYNNENTGYVSLDEKQSKYVYYKYYPIENGYIHIDLIDNPFNDHPDDLVFNGWVTDYKGAITSYDDTYYERDLTIPYNNEKTIEITMHASWTVGKVGYVNGSFNSALNSISDKGMEKIITTKNIYENPDVAGYYISETITTTTEIVSSGWVGTDEETTYGTCTDCYDSNGNYYGNTEYRCPAPSTGWRPSTGDVFTNDLMFETISGIIQAKSNYYEGQYDITNEAYDLDITRAKTMQGKVNISEDV